VSYIANIILVSGAIIDGILGILIMAAMLLLAYIGELLAIILTLDPLLH